MTDDEQQLSLLGDKPNLVVDLPEGIVGRIRDSRHALEQCFNLSCLEPKQVYGPLGIAQATFSKIISGTAFLDPNHRLPFMQLCGNQLPLLYEAEQLGFELQPKRTPLERQLQQKEQQIADLTKKVELLSDIVRGAK